MKFWKLSRDFILGRINRKWDALRTTGMSPIVKATIVMPFFGYLILFNDTLVKYLNLSSLYVYDPNPWTQMRLYFVYFGLVLLAIGSLVYQFFCPAEVKAHGSAWDFIAKQGSTMSELHLEQYRELAYSQYLSAEEKQYGVPSRVLVNIRNLTLFDANNKIVECGGKKIEEEKWEAVVEKCSQAYTLYEDKADALRAYFVPRKDIHKNWSRVVSICYDIGALLLTIPAADVFVRVLISFGNFVLGFAHPSPG